MITPKGKKEEAQRLPAYFCVKVSPRKSQQTSYTPAASAVGWQGVGSPSTQWSEWNCGTSPKLIIGREGFDEGG